MTTPSAFRLQIPKVKSESPSDNEENVRAIERWGNNLPFVRGHRYSIQPNFTIAKSSSHVFDLFPDNGYYPSEPGTFNSIISCTWIMLGNPEDQIYGYEGAQDITLLGVIPGFITRLEETFPEGAGVAMDTGRITTFMGYYDLTEDRRWEPQIEIFNGFSAGTLNLRIKMISALHLFFPTGLTNTLLRDNDRQNQ